MHATPLLKRSGQCLLLGALAASLAACGQSPDPRAGQHPAVSVSIIKIEPRDVPVSYEFVGQAAGSREVEVRARVGGILQKRAYTEGKPVKAGDLLFQIDPQPFQATLNQAEGALAVQKAQLTRAKQDYDRVIPLFKENAVSQKDRDDATAAYEAAKASVASVQAQVDQARINLNYTRVTAPITGITSKEAVTEGNLIAATADASLLTKVTQLDPIYINFSPSDNEMLAIQKLRSQGELKLAKGGLTVKLKQPDGSAYNQTGRLNFTDNIVDTSTGTIRSRASFPNPQGSVLPGQFVRVIVEGAVRNHAIVIPQRAVLTAQQGKMVWVLGADNKPQPRPVKISQEVGHDVLVEEGLKPGDQLIADNLMRVRPGVELKPHPYDASAPAAQAAEGK